MILKDVKCPICGEHDNLEPTTTGPFYDAGPPGVICPVCDKTFAILEDELEEEE